MTQPSRTVRHITVEHVRIETSKPFADVRRSLEELVPPLNTEFRVSVQRGAVAQARRELEALVEFSIFLSRDHGALLRPGPLVQQRTPSPVDDRVVTAQTKASPTHPA